MAMTEDEAIDALLGVPDYAQRVWTLPYERLRSQALQPVVQLFKGERLLVLQPFGWHIDGQHIPNAHEGCSMRGVCEEHDWQVVCDFGPYIAVVRQAQQAIHGRLTQDGE